jgi:glycosyltransferase involved in cell wall biosynthesis
MEKDLSIIIPAYNEEAVIGTILPKTIAQLSDIVAEFIVVNDGSTDNTAEIINQLDGITAIHHSHNRGYGASLKSGIHHARTRYVLTMDSDGQHRPEDVRRLYEHLKQTNADMVVGQRQGLMHSQWWRMPGKWFLKAMADFITKVNIPDLNSGLRLMDKPTLLKYMHLCPSGFSFSTTITMAMLTQGYRVDYVPIEIQKRTGTSTVSLNTGFQTILLIIRIAALFAPLRIFLPVSFVMWAVGIAWGIPYFLAGNGVSVGSMLAIVTGVLIFSLGIICDQISQLRLERYQ